jgi:hypothetical protein
MDFSYGMVICPFCLSIFMMDQDPKDDCPTCNTEEALEDYSTFMNRPRTSFMWTFTDEEGATHDQ